MPDISMCLNNECASRERCYRFKAKPSEYQQAYTEFKPLPGRDRCESFMEIHRKPMNESDSNKQG